MPATVGDYFTFQNGFAFKSNLFSPDGKYKVIRIKELKNGAVRFFEDTARITPEADFDIGKYLVTKGDVLFALTGDPTSKGNPLSWVGRVAYYNYDEPALLNQRVCKAIPTGDISVDYLYYFFRQYAEFKSLASKASGSASQANISTKTIQNHTWQPQPLGEQRRIVTILSSLDKKIELNNKITDNLMDQVNATFSNIFSGKTGDVGTLLDGSFGEIVKAKIDPFDGEKIYIATADVDGTCINNRKTKITFDNRPSRANMQPDAWTVWFAKMKNSRKLYFINNITYAVPEHYIFSTGFYGFKLRKEFFYYIWAYLCTDEFDSLKNTYSTGTTMQAINNDGLDKIKIYIPSEDELHLFNVFAEKAYNQIQANYNSNNKLEETRDTLVSGLMNGMHVLTED